jgi:hypothetical protein
VRQLGARLVVIVVATLHVHVQVRDRGTVRGTASFFAVSFRSFASSPSSSTGTFFVILFFIFRGHVISARIERTALGGYCRVTRRCAAPASTPSTASTRSILFSGSTVGIRVAACLRFGFIGLGTSWPPFILVVVIDFSRSVVEKIYFTIEG